MIESVWYQNTTLFYRNPILVYGAYIVSKVSHLNALTKHNSFLFTMKFMEYLFPKGVLIFQE